MIANSVEGAKKVLEAVNRYGEILFDVIIPNIFAALYEVKREDSEVTRQIILLRKPGGKGYYEFHHDPESHRLRSYFPDFVAKMKDGAYRLIEVKGDNKLEDAVVKAKQEAALDMTLKNRMEYLMLPSSAIMSGKSV